jgi:hypothetical protein
VLRIRQFFCNQIIQNYSNRPNIKWRMRLFFIELFYWSIITCHKVSYSSLRLTWRDKRWPKICYNKNFFVPNKFLEYIIGLKISMNYIFRVNIQQREADHSKNSDNIFFWDHNALILLLDDFCKTLIAFFHYYTWKIISIFDKIFDFYYHRVI